MSWNVPDEQYGSWRIHKAEMLRRPELACGCPNDGRDIYLHTGCPRLACKEHADEAHVCRVPPAEEMRVREEMEMSE
jgi:hypothetical protein